MRAISRAVWTLAALLAVEAALFANVAAESGGSLPITAQSSATCGCGNLSYLVDELNQDNAALDVLSVYEGRYAGPDLISDPAPPPSPAGMTKGQALDAALQEAVGLVGGRQPNASPCALGHTRVTRSQNLAQYATNLKEAYALQSQEILRLLNTLPHSCRPADWFGTITAVETESDSGHETIPSRNTFDQGTEEFFDFTATRTGTIWLSGNSDDPSSSWQVAEKSNKTVVHKQLVSCIGGAKQYPTTLETSGTHEELVSSGSMSATYETRLSVDDDGKNFKLIFTLPAIKETGRLTKTESLSGGCPGNKAPPRQTTTGESTTDEIQVDFEGTMFAGNPVKISGSQTKNLSPAAAQGSRIHTVRVTFHLYKLR